MSKFQTWEEFKEELNITSEEEKEIRMESEAIEKTIKTRKKQSDRQNKIL